MPEIRNEGKTTRRHRQQKKNILSSLAAEKRRKRGGGGKGEPSPRRAGSWIEKEEAGEIHWGWEKPGEKKGGKEFAVFRRQGEKGSPGTRLYSPLT